MRTFKLGYAVTLKTAGLVKEAINPMYVAKRMAARRPTKQLARHFDNPSYIIPDNPFGAAKGAPAESMVGKSIPMSELPPTRSPVGRLSNWLTGIKAPATPDAPDLRDAPLSPMLSENPMSSAIRKQYPKAPNMAAQMERTENALAAKLGPQRSAEMPVYLREGIERTNYIPPGTEKMVDVQKDMPDSPMEAWDALKGTMLAPQGSGQINMGINDPAILAHEGRHAQQFLPAEGSGYRPGMMQGKPFAVPRENITGKPFSELDELLEIERDANLSVPQMIQDITPEQMAMQGAAQGTYESMVDPSLRKLMWGELGDVLPTGAQTREVIERLMRGEDLEQVVKQTGAADDAVRYGKRVFGGGEWYDEPGTPKALQDRYRRGAELTQKLRGRDAEDLLSDTGVQARATLPEEGSYEALNQRNKSRRDAWDVSDEAGQAMEDMADEDIPLRGEVGYHDNPMQTEGRLSPMGAQMGPFDKQFWRAAGSDPESVAFQAKRHQAVTDQLRTALGDDYANAYDTYVRQQVGQADPEGLFNTAMTPTQQQGKPSSFVDKIKGMFG
jgi:hypothetical protein